MYVMNDFGYSPSVLMGLGLSWTSYSLICTNSTDMW